MSSKTPEGREQNLALTIIMKSELARGHRTNTHKASLTTHIKAL
jgi:hypothetical protein